MGTALSLLKQGNTNLKLNLVEKLELPPEPLHEELVAVWRSPPLPRRPRRVIFFNRRTPMRAQLRFSRRPSNDPCRCEWCHAPTRIARRLHVPVAPVQVQGIACAHSP